MTKDTTFSSSAGSCERQRTKSMWKKCGRTILRFLRNLRENKGEKNFFQKKLCVLKNVVFLHRETKGVP